VVATWLAHAGSTAVASNDAARMKALPGVLVLIVTSVLGTA
jgi:hypothetical protein